MTPEERKAFDRGWLSGCMIGGVIVVVALSCAILLSVTLVGVWGTCI